MKGTFQTFIGSLPAISNIGALLMLIVLIYSILGVYIFADIMHSENSINDDVNFMTVGSSILALIRVTTGE